MRALIPTAGVGSRLQPFTHAVPKVLLQVADKPILAHIVDRLIEEGVQHMTFVVGYRGDMIEAFVREHYPGIHALFVQQEEPRGLGHAIYITRELQADANEPLLIILGDTLLEADLRVLQDAQTSLIGVKTVDDPRRFGVVEMQNGRIVRMVEKPERPASNLAIVGAYYITDPDHLYRMLESNIRQGVLTKGEIQLTDALQKMIDDGAEMGTFEVEGWHDCGTPETLLYTNRVLLKARFMDDADSLETRYSTAKIKPPVWIAPTAKIRDSIIGPGVTVAAHAELENVIVRNSIVSQHARVRNVYLADSVIGNHAIVSEPALRLYVGDNSEIIFETPQTDRTP